MVMLGTTATMQIFVDWGFAAAQSRYHHSYSDWY